LSHNNILNKMSIFR